MKTLATVLVTAALVASQARAADDFVSADDARALAGKPNVRFVFADTDKEFEKGHVPGSVVAYAHDLYYLERSCMVQCLAQRSGRMLRQVSDRMATDVCNAIEGERQQSALHFASLKRLLDRDEPGWSKG